MFPYRPLLTSLLFLGWFLFTPSAWRRYVAQIDPQLPPNFALTDLTSSHWHQPALQTLLFTGHGLWSLWSSGLVMVILWLFFQASEETILLTTVYTLCFSLIGGLLGSLTVSVAFGIMVSSIGSVLLSLPIGLAGEVVFSMAKNVAIAVMLSMSDLPDFPTGNNLSENSPVMWTVLLGTFAASLAGSVMYSTTKTVHTPPAYRQIGSIVVGVGVSGIVLFLLTLLIGSTAGGVAMLIENGLWFSLAYDGIINVVFGLSLALIVFLQTWRWQPAFWWGLGASVGLGVFTLLKNQFHTAFLPLNVLADGIHGGIENAYLYLLLFAFPYVLAKRIATPWAGIIAGIFGSTGAYVVFAWITQSYTLLFLLPLTLLAFALGLSNVWWRPLLCYPFLAAWNLLILRADEKRSCQPTSLLRWHSAFWDEYQYLPLFGLENYLVLVTEHNPHEGRFALEYLSTSPQRWAVREAHIELDARRLQRSADVKSISATHRSLATGELSSPVSALLRSFSRLSRDIEAALAQESTYNQRLALDSVEERLDSLFRELTSSSEPYATRFLPIAATWRQTISEHIRTLTEAVESRQEISNPYVIGIPLTEHQEIFVGRSDISESIEKLLLDVRCPPLLLYGQRRTGKTSLLNNLGKLLPWKIIPLFVDLQGPTSLAKNYQGFLYNISRAMLTSAKRHRQLQLPPLTKEKLNEDPFTSFDEWLDEIEQSIDATQNMLLILDEFSALEHVFTKGLLDEESVLGMFRHLIQHRSRLKILLSGSHTIDEFERWASYLINVQTVHISYLQPKEALQLIEQPVKDFSLRYDPEASQRVLQLTHCHPALIQLVCSEMVSLKNKQDLPERRLAQVADVEAAIPGALQHGRFFFADIANNQVTPHALAMLRYLATFGEQTIVRREVLESQCPEEFDQTLNNLLRRELIEAVVEGYRFQVELIRRWFV